MESTVVLSNGLLCCSDKAFMNSRSSRAVIHPLCRNEAILGKSSNLD